MQIDIRTSEELSTLLDALAMEIVDANIYFRLFSDIIDDMPEYEHELMQSKTFWHLTMQALKDAWLTRICRVFDQESKSLNLVNLLDTIACNLPLFQDKHFRQRLESNAYVDSLAETCRVPSEVQLKEDIEYASSRNPAVRKLMIWRNNTVAHRGASISLGRKQILDDNPMSQQEIQELLDRSFEIFNRYSSLYRASTWSRQIIGNDDYRYLLKFIRLGVQKFRDDSPIG